MKESSLSSFEPRREEKTGNGSFAPKKVVSRQKYRCIGRVMLQLGK